MEKEFKPFDRVIVRDSDTDTWTVTLYSHEYSQGHHTVCGGFIHRQCLPYEGNEELVGTWKSPKQKRWRAEKGDLYWHLTTYATVTETADIYTPSDDARYEAGNYFETKEEAEMYATIIKNALER